MSETVRNILEIGLGALYVIGALFNMLYTRNHGEAFFGGFAEGAVIAPMGKLTRKLIIPHARTFTLLLVSFQALVALTIFSRGPLATYGLIAGAIFCMAAAAASNIPGAIANLLLSAAQLLLASAR